MWSWRLQSLYFMGMNRLITLVSRSLRLINKYWNGARPWTLISSKSRSVIVFFPNQFQQTVKKNHVKLNRIMVWIFKRVKISLYQPLFRFAVASYASCWPIMAHLSPVVWQNRPVCWTNACEEKKCLLPMLSSTWSDTAAFRRNTKHSEISKKKITLMKLPGQRQPPTALWISTRKKRIWQQRTGRRVGMQQPDEPPNN